MKSHMDVIYHPRSSLSPTQSKEPSSLSVPPTLSSPLAVPATLFISALDLFALELLLQYFQVRNAFPPQSLAQGCKPSRALCSQCHTQTGGTASLSWTTVLISTRNSWKSFSMVYSYTHALIRVLNYSLKGWVFSLKVHQINCLKRPEAWPITDKTPSWGNPARSPQRGEKFFWPMYSL